MTKAKALRIAPSRDGKQIASVWRFWAQGDEFYAASRDVVKLGKISFHTNFNWQYRIGSAVIQLARPLVLSSGWLHAVQLTFLVKPGLLLPLARPDGRVRLIETPVAAKLVLNLLRSSHTRRPMLKPLRETGGTVVASHRLRSGASLIVTSRVLPMDANDLAIIDDIQTKLRVNLTGRPEPGKIFVEAAWHQFDPRTGNAIAVVPAGYDTLQAPSADAAT